MFDSRIIWHCGPFRFDQKLPLIVGVLNVTPDSFSDGGRYSSSLDALRHAAQMLEAGADIIEVGGESSRPGTRGILPDVELERVLPVIKALVDEGICVSLDSQHPEVSRVCVDAGVAIINDITGFRDPGMVALAQQSDVACVIMHMQGTPQTMQLNPHYDDVVGEISTFLQTQAQLLEDSGVRRERLCVDPGPGFGKDFGHNRLLLQNTAHFANLGSPNHPYLLMAAWSRKGFIGKITGEEIASRRVAGSVAAAMYAASQGAGVLRVHDVKETVDALKVLEVAYG